MYLDPQDPRRPLGASIFSNTQNTLHRTKNLRCLTDYARKHEVLKCTVEQYQGGGFLTVWYANDSIGLAQFASFAVMQGWVIARRKRRGPWWGCEVSTIIDGVASTSGGERHA